MDAEILELGPVWVKPHTYHNRADKPMPAQLNRVLAGEKLGMVTVTPLFAEEYFIYVKLDDLTPREEQA